MNTTHHGGYTRLWFVLVVVNWLCAAGCVTSDVSKNELRILVAISQLHLSKVQFEPGAAEVAIPAELVVENISSVPISLERDFMLLKVAGRSFVDPNTQSTWVLPKWKASRGYRLPVPFDLILSPSSRTNMVLEILAGGNALQLVNQHLIPGNSQPKPPRELQMDADFTIFGAVNGRTKRVMVTVIDKTVFD